MWPVFIVALVLQSGMAHTDNKPRILAATRPVSLGNAPVRAVLASVDSTALLTQSLRTLPAHHRVYLVLRDLHAAKAPGVLYAIRFGTSGKATKEASTKSNTIGVFNYYDSVDTDSDAEKNTGNAANNGRFFSYDITDRVRDLLTHNRLSDIQRVTISPESGVFLKGAKPRIGRIELVVQ